MQKRPMDTPATDRLLTPLGGMVLSLVLSLTLFWWPVLNLLT